MFHLNFFFFAPSPKKSFVSGLKGDSAQILGTAPFIGSSAVEAAFRRQQAAPNQQTERKALCKDFIVMRRIHTVSRTRISYTGRPKKNCA